MSRPSQPPQGKSQGKSQNMWSRRRAAVQAEAEAEKRTAETKVTARQRAELSRQSDAEILDKLDLKDPGQMQAGDDFAAFMKDEVPQRLRRRALRTLWRSNPTLACLDDLVEYNEDFKAEWTGGVVRTAYQVGKGMLAHVQEMERQKAGRALQDADPAMPEAEAEAAVVADAPPDEVPPPEAPPDQSAAVLAAPVDDPEPVAAQVDAPVEDAPQYTAPRRMRFEFDEA